jgi:hypothetical protein
MWELFIQVDDLGQATHMSGGWRRLEGVPQVRYKVPSYMKPVLDGYILVGLEHCLRPEDNISVIDGLPNLYNFDELLRGERRRAIVTEYSYQQDCTQRADAHSLQRIMAMQRRHNVL